MTTGFPPRRTALLFALAAAAAVPCRLAAQATAPDSVPSLSAPIPTDPAVLVGRLPNGLAYYVRVNHKPEKRAELRLVVNAGSVLEDSTQRGLAHLIEHMAFDGTTHFPRQRLISYLESTGVRFGADLNAQTGFDETIYRLTVPTDSAGLLETGIQILGDWAHGVTFDPHELPRERNVVVEEWRLGRGAGQRIRDKQFPVLFQGSRYAVRLPIGDPHIVKTATRANLERFYHTWYRPDLQAVVAVGDFDAAHVVRLIRQRFGDIPAPADTLTRPITPVPAVDSTRVSVATDPEATTTGVAIYHLFPARAERTVGDYRQRLVESLYNGMLNDRLAEIAQQPNPPVIGAYSAEGQLVRAEETYVLSALVPGGGIARGLRMLLTEAERVAQHGFTATELARQKADLLRATERAFAERDKTSSARFVGAYVNHYLNGDPIPSIAQDYALTRALLPGIRLSEVNALAHRWLADPDRVITASAPAKDSARTPSAAALLALADSVRREQVAAYVDSVTEAPLVPMPPAPGRIVAERTDSTVGVTEWTLSNGVRVVLKPTTFRDDELLVRAFSPGGTSLAPDSLLVPARTATDVVEAGGVGAFTATALAKALAGKSVGVSPYIGAYSEGISAGGSPTDAATMFQLIYLYFTAPRADTAAFRSFQQRMQAYLADRGASPRAAFADTLTVTLYRHHPRALPITSATFARMNLKQSLRFYRQRFADASGFTFVLVGNIDITRLRPLVERYLGGLPTTHAADHWRDVGLAYARGVLRRTVTKGTDPRSSTQIVFTGPFAFTRHGVYEMEALSSLMELRLRNRLRQQLGGTYGVSVSASPQRVPHGRYQIAIGFSAAPQRMPELVRATFADLDSLRAVGPSAGDVEKVRETQLRERETALRRNGVWASLLTTYLENGWPLDGILRFENDARHLTPVSLRDAARRYLNNHNYVQVTLVPEGSASRARGSAGAGKRPDP